METTERYMTLRRFIEMIQDIHPEFGAANLKALCHVHGFPWSAPMQASTPGCRTEGFYPVYMVDILKYILDSKRGKSRFAYAPIMREIDELLLQALRRDEALLGDLFLFYKVMEKGRSEIRAAKAALDLLLYDRTPSSSVGGGKVSVSSDTKKGKYKAALNGAIDFYIEVEFEATQHLNLLPGLLQGFWEYQYFVDLCTAWGKSRDKPEIGDRAAQWGKELEGVR